MAKKSFSDVDSQHAEVPAEASTPTETTTAMTVVADASVEVAAPDDAYFSNDGFGDIDQSKVAAPFLELVHGVGDLAKKGYRPGSLVLGKEMALLEPKTGQTVVAPEDGLNMILLGAYEGGLCFLEVVSDAEFKAMQARGEFPRIFKTERDARKAGLVSAGDFWGASEAERKELRQFAECLKVRVLIENKNAALTVDGVTYSPAIVSFSKGSWYKAAGQDLYSYVGDCRTVGTPVFGTRFKLYTKYVQSKKSANGKWCMFVQRSSKLTADGLNFVRRLL